MSVYLLVYEQMEVFKNYTKIKFKQIPLIAFKSSQILYSMNIILKHLTSKEYFPVTKKKKNFF